MNINQEKTDDDNNSKCGVTSLAAVKEIADQKFSSENGSANISIQPG